MITLEEFSELLFAAGSEWTVCYVYDEEDSADDKARGESPEPLLTLCSAYKPSLYLKPLYAKAEVCGFYALERNVLAVWVKIRNI